MQALSCAIELVGSCPALEEADATFRCMAAIGTLLAAGGKDLSEVGAGPGVGLEALRERARKGPEHWNRSVP